MIGVQVKVETLHRLDPQLQTLYVPMFRKTILGIPYTFYRPFYKPNGVMRSHPSKANARQFGINQLKQWKFNNKFEFNQKKAK